MNILGRFDLFPTCLAYLRFSKAREMDCPCRFDRAMQPVTDYQIPFFSSSVSDIDKTTFISLFSFVADTNGKVLCVCVFPKHTSESLYLPLCTDKREYL